MLKTLTILCFSFFSFALSDASAAFSVIANIAAGSTSSTAVTTGSVDTTGATFMVVWVASYKNATFPTLTDSKSNTWTAASLRTCAGPFCAWGKFFYVNNPTVGSGHTFTVTCSGSCYPSVEAQAFSGNLTTATPFDQESGGTAAQPGSITPSVANSLLVTAYATDTVDTLTVDSGFTISDQITFVSGQRFGSAMAYLIETSIAAQNPTWSAPMSTAPGPSAMIVFKPAPSGGVQHRVIVAE